MKVNLVSVKKYNEISNLPNSFYDSVSIDGKKLLILTIPENAEAYIPIGWVEGIVEEIFLERRLAND